MFIRIPHSSNLEWNDQFVRWHTRKVTILVPSISISIIYNPFHCNLFWFRLPPIFDLLHHTPSDDLWIILQICRILGGASYFVAGVMAMYVNQCWKRSRRRKLAFWISWFNGIGGFVFFISGFCSVIPGDMVQSTLFPLGYLIGSVFYLGGSVGALMMWKLNQFGYVLSTLRL